MAVKMIRKEKRPRNNSEPDYLMKEMDIPKNLDHPCITKVLEVQSEKLFVIVMELAPGGELFDQVINNDCLHCMSAFSGSVCICIH